MKIRAVVVDDEKPARDRVRRLLRDHPDVTVVGEAADVTTAVDLIEKEKPDLCFLDVQMPGGDGFDVLRKLKHVPRIVFATAYDQYAVRAFEVNSLDYLLKPFDRKRFDAAMARVRESIRQDEAPPGEAVRQLLEQLRSGLPQIKALADRVVPGESPATTPTADEPERIPARRGARILLLEPDEVLCFEAEDTLVYARTPRGRFMVERTLADLEQQLSSRFFRTHRGYLVNLAQVGEIHPEDAGTFRIVLKDEDRTEVPLSRRQARRLRERIPW
jgi:DNA-binding LytR/AlgR family response regulator